MLKPTCDGSKPRIICHLPPICHHPVSPLYKGNPRVGGRVADKNTKNYFVRDTAQMANDVL